MEPEFDPFGVEDISAIPLHEEQLHSWFFNTLVAAPHFGHGLGSKLGAATVTKLSDFITYVRSVVPSAVKKVERFEKADAMGNKPIAKAAKRFSFRASPVDFFRYYESLIPSGNAVPRIWASMPIAPPSDDSDPHCPPLIVHVGDVLEMNDVDSSYFVLCTEIVDPRSFHGTFAVAYGVRLWTADEITALGFPGAGEVAGKLGQRELALSKYRDLVRPATIIRKVRFVPHIWADPEDQSGAEYAFKYYFDYENLRIFSVDLHLASEPWRLLNWMRTRYMCSNGEVRRTWDFVVDRIYHAFVDRCLAACPQIAEHGKLMRLTTVIDRDWFLLLPSSVLQTARYSEEHGGSFAVWARSLEEAELMLGPSSELPSAANGGASVAAAAAAAAGGPLAAPPYRIVQHDTEFPGRDPTQLLVTLPIQLWFCPRREGHTDILCFKAHMERVHVGHVLWSTRNVIPEPMQVGDMTDL